MLSLAAAPFCIPLKSVQEFRFLHIHANSCGLFDQCLLFMSVFYMRRLASLETLIDCWVSVNLERYLVRN